MKVDILRDQSRYIHAALHEINLHLVLGSILASLVVFAFMRSWRTTVIAAVAIPASVISAFGMMWALGFTLNSVTMLALVLMVGIVIDDAIVVLENIFRFVEEKRMSPFEAARAATADIGLAVMATTFSLVVIFVPVSFMSSVSGRFLYQFGLTAAVSVLVSLLVSFTLTPMMSARMLRAEDAAGEHDAARSRRGFYRWIDAAYAWLLRLAITPVGRVVVVGLALAAVAATVPLYGMVKREYVPTDVDEAEFQLSFEGPEGLSLAAIDEVVQAMDREIRAVRGVRLVLLSAGGSFLGRVNQGNGYVRIAPHDERTVTPARLWDGLRRGDPLSAFRGNYTQREVMQEVRQRLRKFRDMRIQVRNIPGFNIGGGSFDIDYVLRGPELSTLARYGEELRERALAVGGMVDLNTTLRLDRPELRVQIDRDRAADLRVEVEQIATALRLMVGGDQEVSRFHDPVLDQDYDVQLRLSEGDRRDPRTIERLYVSRSSSSASTSLGAAPQVGMAPGGGLVRLDNVVKIAAAETAARIDRSDRQRENRLRGGVAPGYGQADRIDALRQLTAEMNLPAGYTTVVAGQAREFERTFVEFLWVFLLAVIFMYMILASQFESLVHPFTILLSLPLAVPFALFSLWYTGNTINLYSALGILVLFGVVKKNAILQIDQMNSLRQAGHDRRTAILLGNRNRLRPILMTTLALVGGMLPLWHGDGPGVGGAAGHRRRGHRRADALAPADAAGHPRRLSPARRPWAAARLEAQRPRCPARAGHARGGGRLAPGHGARRARGRGAKRPPRRERHRRDRRRGGPRPGRLERARGSPALAAARRPGGCRDREVSASTPSARPGSDPAPRSPARPTLDVSPPGSDARRACSPRRWSPRWNGASAPGPAAGPRAIRTAPYPAGDHRARAPRHTRCGSASSGWTKTPSGTEPSSTSCVRCRPSPSTRSRSSSRSIAAMGTAAPIPRSRFASSQVALKR